MRSGQARGAPDGNTIRSARTRARILAASRALFNARGAAAVSTGAIAAELEISPGNLHYHFRTKDAIVAVLLDELAARVEVAPPAAATAAEAIEDLWLYLHLMLEAIHDYRFLYRGGLELAARDPALRARFARIAAAQLAAVRSLCGTLERRGALAGTPEALDAIAANIVVVATYWPEFEALLPAAERRARDAVGQGAYQVMALVAPHLAGDARRLLERIGRRYLD